MAYKSYIIQERDVATWQWARTGEAFHTLLEALERRDERRAELRRDNLTPDCRVVDDCGRILDYQGE